MALSRRTGQRFQASIWPGFVDAMTGLLLVLFFVLSIFMVVQFTLRETITGQESELDELSREVSALAQALGLQEERGANLQERVGSLTATLNDAQDEAARQAALIAALTAERDQTAAALDDAQTRITSFEAQVAALIAERDGALGTIADLEGAQAELLSEQAALNLALAQARSEIDAGAEAARLAAARREALDALIADLRARNAEVETTAAGLRADLDTARAALSEEEAARIAEAAAAEQLRQRLAEADDELTAMTLALEEQRKRAEDTLTLLAAAESVEAELDEKLIAALLSLEALEAERAGLAGQAEGLGATVQQLEADRAVLGAQVADLEQRLAAAQGENDQVAAERDALQTRLADAEIDALTQESALQAQLDIAQTEAAELRARLQALEARFAEAAAQVDTSEQSRAELRAQLTAALAAKIAAETLAEDQSTEAERRAALLATARQQLASEEDISAEAQRRAALLNQQVAALRTQLGELQALLDDARERDAAKDVQLQSLGSELNTALARVAAEERRRRQLEEEERKRLEATAQDLERYRSEFFGRLRDLLGTQEGVRIVGDRFVFSSEVLFQTGQARLSAEGAAQIAGIANILRNVANDIPPEIDWVLQVDGHTDNIPLSGFGQFADNWELSQARALSVVRYMVGTLGIAPDRLSANGFGEFQPVNAADTPEARAQNRRIEIKFTEK